MGRKSSVGKGLCNKSSWEIFKHDKPKQKPMIHAVINLATIGDREASKPTPG